MAPERRQYHHGDLRPALLAAAIELVEELGPAGVSLRQVARKAGVTHPAASYHFGDKSGLFTALAVEGYRMLEEALADAEGRGDRTNVSVAYVRFATEHRAYFEVIHRPELYRLEDVDLVEARRRVVVHFYGSEEHDVSTLSGGVASWALAHGVATLWLSGHLPKKLGRDPQAITRVVSARVTIDFT